MQAHTFSGILLKGSITSANDTGRWKTPSHPKERSIFTLTLLSIFQLTQNTVRPSPYNHRLVIGDEPYSPGRTDSQSLGGHGDQESWSSDQTNTANCPATQTTTQAGLSQPRSQKEAKLLSHFHHLPTVERATERLEVYG